MVGCSVLGCKSRSEKKITGITFHSFPLNPDIRSEWITAAGKKNWQPTKYSKMCSVHFNDDSFIYKKKIVLLDANSVPIKHIHIRKPGDQGSTDQLTQPSASQQNIHYTVTSSTKRRKNVLNELQYIQMKKRSLVSSSDLDITVSDKPVPPTPKKEKQLIKQLHNEKIKSAIRIKKLRAARESNRRLLKKIIFLENIVADLKYKMRMGSEELDLSPDSEPTETSIFESVRKVSDRNL